ncbi:MAG TPA: iron chelate uptake ABC transporter family permease subunit [Micromonosporaceae bacterium]|jgi:zinc/manganese transport system permease protein
MNAAFTWNLVNDIREMWSHPFMVNAFRAGTVVAILAALVGWFMVLRRQSFAGHTLALVGFPGAAAAVWLGIGAATGYFAFCVIAALVIAALPAVGQRGHSEESAVIGTVQAFALAAGMLFVALYGGFLNGINALLFGSFIGISSVQVTTLAAVAVAVLAVLAGLGRPLLFTSIDSDVARANGVPARLLATVFLVLLGATAAEVSQITGALLVFALLVLPPATAQRLSARPAVSIPLSVVLALVTVWLSLFIAYYSPYPIGFWLTTIGFGMYALTYLPTPGLRRAPRTAVAEGAA